MKWKMKICLYSSLDGGLGLTLATGCMKAMTSVLFFGCVSLSPSKLIAAAAPRDKVTPLHRDHDHNSSSGDDVSAEADDEPEGYDDDSEDISFVPILP